MLDNSKEPATLSATVESLVRIADRHTAIERPVCHTGTKDSFRSQIDVSLEDPTGASPEELESALSDFLRLNPDVGRLGFHKQLYSGVNLPAVLGEWVATLSNSVMHTFKVGPVSNLMEAEVVNQLSRLVGFENGEGLMVSGASQANLVSMMLARHALFPDLKETGYAGRELVAFVSDQAHYSMARAANVIGIGTRNLVAVRSDADGRMMPDALRHAIEAAIKDGKIPFYIGLTAGTTVLGAFDPVPKAVALAREFGLWVHVDGAWGAPVLFSQSHADLLSGCDEADSFTWDAHKLLNVPLTAGIILTRQKGWLHAATSGGGENYLFHKEAKQEQPEPELGELSIQSARRADCVKVWSAWKAVGRDGFAQKVDHLMEQKAHFLAYLNDQPDFDIIAPAPYLNVLFQYRPQHNSIAEPDVSKLNVAICERLAETGEAFIDYASFSGRTGIRMILAHSDISELYLNDLCDRIRQVGDALEIEQQKSLL
ncbi:aminotransferase class V-fold PLP-dependent enzyme [Tateyamaria omphalii]|uniref:pyridoxal phosphate-dependent decarboxylase family protein n=1 Tax=Tateyamaria omphalii TaxID=299262 RepID=UPI001C9974BF|nr:pyridoxal-dependent decarboxylase [Tateyamaria omphalii]MBY5935077.1 aminotransferase class V-fold PLP-dependent enzyme [Tateyamaria omphalii]